MGQAKSRGSAEQRKAQAIAAARAAQPATVKCNDCQTELSNIEPVNVRAMPGLVAAGAAHCQCGSSTWMVDGTPEAKAAFAEFLAQEHGDTLKVGTASRPAA